MTVASYGEPTAAVAQHGFVSEAPKAPGDPFTVRMPAFGDEHVFEIRRYESRGATIPVEGDEVLVIDDDVSEPWVAAWWPAGGDAEASSFVVGPKGATDGALVAFDGTTGALVKAAGPITSEMIEAIEASKITGQIVETQIGPEAVTTPKLAAGSVTAGKIVAGTITATQIAAGTIVASNIASGTITATQISAGTITSKEIAAETIKGTNIAATTITGAKIVAETLEAGHLKAGTITATQIAAGTITASQIAAHTISAGQIEAGSITSTEIAANTITANQIAAATITGKEIAAVTITAANIASGTILGGNIASGTITAGNITISKLSALSGDLGTITAGIVTGATLRTAATGSRVVIDSEGLHAFNATEGVLDFNIGTGNLVLKGEVKAGSTVPASTVTGELTNAQIKEIAAAKITGTIVETQIGPESISTGKLAASAVTSAKIAANTIVAGNIAAGTITSTEIKAATIKGTNIAAETIETGNLKAEAITAAKIAALTITSSQIAASTITGAKIAAETITATNIAASTITAGKLNVTTLSAISANLGAITAGTITGATFQTTGALPMILDNNGLSMPENEGAETFAPKSVLAWRNAAGKVTAEVIATNVSEAEYLYVWSNRNKVRPEGKVDLLANGKTGRQAMLQLTAGEGASTPRIMAKIEEEEVVILDPGRVSSFLQLATNAKKKFASGVVKVEFKSSTSATGVKVTHGLGATPTSVVVTQMGTELGALFARSEAAGETTFTVSGYSPFGAVNGTATFAWQATT